LKADHNNTGSEVAFYNTAGGVTYRPLDELSDSDETDMDISGDEAEAAEGPSNKRARLAVEQSASDNNAPKWSNPDPYTALPPEMATQQGKRKDVVQLIRKARVAAKEVRTSLPSESADFISLDFDDSDDEDDSDYKPQEPTASAGPSAAPSIDSAQPDLRLPPKPVPVKPAKSSLPFPDPTPSALGSRKRTHDDEIKMPHTRLKKVIRTKASGGITKDWLPDPELDSTPWMTVDHSQSASMAVW
jgi:non-canonical poly(A) RNA polymerase PAPD5/7